MLAAALAVAAAACEGANSHSDDAPVVTMLVSPQQSLCYDSGLDSSSALQCIRAFCTKQTPYVQGTSRRILCFAAWQDIIIPWLY